MDAEFLSYLCIQEFSVLGAALALCLQKPSSASSQEKTDEGFIVCLGGICLISRVCPVSKTNAARILDRLKLTYELLTYEVDPDDLAAESTAEKLGLPPEQVFKTLVAKGDRHGICLAVIPGSAQLDLKALALLTGDRKVDTVPLKDVQPLTGYIRGGVTALGTKKAYPVYVDDSILTFEAVAVSAGKRGLMLWLSPQDYLAATQGRVGAIARLA